MRQTARVPLASRDGSFLGFAVFRFCLDTMSKTVRCQCCDKRLTVPCESASNVPNSLPPRIFFDAANRELRDRDFVETSGMTGYPDRFKNQDASFVYSAFDRNQRRAFSYGGRWPLVVNQQVTTLEQIKEKH